MTNVYNGSNSREYREQLKEFNWIQFRACLRKFFSKNRQFDILYILYKLTSSSLSRSWKIPSSSSVSTLLSSFSLDVVSLAAGSSTAANDELEISSNLKNKFYFLHPFFCQNTFYLLISLKHIEAKSKTIQDFLSQDQEYFYTTI